MSWSYVNVKVMGHGNAVGPTSIEGSFFVVRRLLSAPMRLRPAGEQHQQQAVADSGRL